MKPIKEIEEELWGTPEIIEQYKQTIKPSQECEEELWGTPDIINQ